MILMNHGLFFQEKDSLQLNRFQFLEINSLIAGTIKNQFSKTNCWIGNKLFSLKNWKRLTCRESFFQKNDLWFIRITSFSKIWYDAIRKKVRVKITFVKCIIFLWFFIHLFYTTKIYNSRVIKIPKFVNLLFNILILQIP